LKWGEKTQVEVLHHVAQLGKMYLELSRVIVKFVEFRIVKKCSVAWIFSENIKIISENTILFEVVSCFCSFETS